MGLKAGGWEGRGHGTQPCVAVCLAANDQKHLCKIILSHTHPMGQVCGQTSLPSWDCIPYSPPTRNNTLLDWLSPVSATARPRRLPPPTRPKNLPQPITKGVERPPSHQRGDVSRDLRAEGQRVHRVRVPPDEHGRPPRRPGGPPHRGPGPVQGPLLVAPTPLPVPSNNTIS